MSMSDTIADMLTRIRNALRSRHDSVNIPASNKIEGICRVLKDEGYINGYTRIDDTKQGFVKIDLKYGPRGEDVILRIKRVSKPGCKIYSTVEKLPRPLNGLGIVVVSTSAGILSDRECREKNVSGEVLCMVE